LKNAVDALGRNPSDAELHQIRILAKRSRYAADAVAPLVGPVASRFAAAVADVQTVLGDHHDTVMAEEWLHSAAKADESVKPVANQLIALERSRRRELRDQWPATWRAASAQKLRSWL
jgi:CHAD domain-containing protein